MGTNQNTEGSFWTPGNTFLLRGWLSTGTVVFGGCGFLHLWDMQKLTSSWGTSFSCPCVSREVGLDNARYSFQTKLNHSMILQIKLAENSTSWNHSLVRLEGTLKITQFQHPCHRRTPSLHQVAQRPIHPTWSWILPERGHLQPPWASCSAVSHHPYSEKLPYI